MKRSICTLLLSYTQYTIDKLVRYGSQRASNYYKISLKFEQLVGHILITRKTQKYGGRGEKYDATNI